MPVEYPELAELAATGRVPRHIAVIMDGNGRWAKMRGLPRLSGHKAGSETVRRLLGYCRDAGVDYLTLYAFSTENWGRPPEEVSGLMQLLGNFIADNEKELLAQQIRLRLIGRREDLPTELLGSIERMEAATAGFKRQLLVALSYSGRSELVHAVRQIAGQVKSGALDPQKIDESAIAANLYAPDVPDPDLIIRTSGELRVSNFLLWQCAYSEFYVTPVLWPDFDEATFADAVKAYMARNRRYGKV